MTSISLKKLDQWEGNVRKTAADQDIHELAASIDAHGLLSPLTVQQSDNGRFAVIAGQRRLMALQSLAADGKLGSDAPIACTILAEGVDPTEASLGENVVRTAMHPADQFDAWRDLADKGLSPSEIAARFGATEAIVNKRLKLGRVSPKIMALYRDGKIGLDSVEAFTVSDDHAEQERVWEGRTRWFGPSDIRRALTQGEIAATDKRARLVGLDAYEAAGGPVRRDLFDDRNAGWVQDLALLDRLLAEKLQAVADEVKAEGWKWVEVRDQFDQYGSAYHKEFATCERGKAAKLTPEEQAERKALAQDHQALDGIDEDGGTLTEDQERRMADIEARLDELDSRPEVFGKDILKRAGAVVTIGYDGLKIIRGLVRKADAPGKAADHGESPPGPIKSPFSQSLRESLTKEVTGAMQGELCVRPHMALVALLHGQFTSYGSPVHVTFTRQSCTSGSLAEQAVDDAGNLPGTEEVDMHDGQAVWDWLVAMSDARLLELMAARVAQTVSAGDKHSGMLRAAQALDLRKWFTPDAENYFGKVSKDQMLADLAEMGVTGDELKACGSMKKGELAKAAAKVATERAPWWLPEPMRLAERADDVEDEESAYLESVDDEDMEEAA